jgi:hypothetical protein
MMSIVRSYHGLSGEDSEGIDPLESNWIWGLSLIALTMAVHATGIAFLAVLILRLRRHLETLTRLGLRHLLVLLAVQIGAVGLLLAMLHGVEAGLWAAAYWWLGGLELPSEAILYSVDSMSTRGASGLMLEHHWHMLGALEAMDGMLLFGMSTAFIFAALQGYWPLITRQLRHP